jgi:hypothetical protein
VSLPANVGALRAGLGFGPPPGPLVCLRHVVEQTLAGTIRDIGCSWRASVRLAAGASGASIRMQSRPRR